MRFTTRYLPALALIGLAIPALASGEARAPGTIEAYDFGFRNTAGGGSSVTISAGETVTFNYPSGCGDHNVAFTGNGRLLHPDRRRQRSGARAASQPRSCRSGKETAFDRRARIRSLRPAPPDDGHRRGHCAACEPGADSLAAADHSASDDDAPARPSRESSSSRATSAVRPSAAP